jgi:hypothetical protein
MLKQIFIFLVALLILLSIVLIVVLNIVPASDKPSKNNMHSANIITYTVPFPKPRIDTSGYDTVATTASFAVSYNGYGNIAGKDNSYDARHNDNRDNNHDSSHDHYHR